jgi:hypothetical protein
MTKEVNNRCRSIPCKLRGSNKALSGRQLQEAEAPGASEEDMGTSPERSTAYFVVKTRDTIQERFKSPSKSKKRLQKPKPDKVNRSRSCTLLRVIHPTHQNMWVIILQLLLLRLVSRKFLGNSFHLRRHYNLPTHEASSQKGANRPINSKISGRGPKLAQLIALCLNQNTYTERYPTYGTVLHSPYFSFQYGTINVNLVFLSFLISRTSFVYVKMKYNFVTDLRECRSYEEIFLREYRAKNRSESFTKATKRRS